MTGTGASGQEAGASGHGAPVRQRVHVLPDAAAAAHAAAVHVVEIVRGDVARSGRCHIALSGGSTPRPLFHLLARHPGDPIPWQALHVWWADERCVPPDDAASNYLLAHDALLRHVPLPPGHIHRVRGELPGDEAAAMYGAELADAFRAPSPGELPRGNAALDLVLLGLGEDGHTASLFPGSEALGATGWAAPARAPEGVRPPERVTLTVPALNASRRALFLVTGSEKARAVRRARVEGDVPAARIAARDDVVWILDAAAAAALDGPPGEEGDGDGWARQDSNL